MRLINSSTLQLEEFLAEIPDYAILSHTWGDDEVLFNDMENETTREKKGFDKISKCCELAASEGYQYVWIDTCCIDKASSAELSEAINSMFDYYGRSGKCFVYLDVEIPDGNMTSQDLENARWTSRGWTLQELIAPHLVDFYDISWKCCGSRSSHHMELSHATRIPSRMFKLHRNSFHSHRTALKIIAEYSIAQRMSWASTRHVTRPEDIAYCLLGIFNVHLPPLYGEGGVNAFRRLQEEIIKTSTDLSILAWDARPYVHRDRRNVLANSPDDFAGAGTISCIRDSSMEDFSLTNRLTHQVTADSRKGYLKTYFHLYGGIAELLSWA